MSQILPQFRWAAALLAEGFLPATAIATGPVRFEEPGS